MGGISAGLVSGAGMATGLWDTGAQLAGMGLDASAQPLAASGTNVGASAGTGQIAPPADMSAVPSEAIAPPGQMSKVTTGAAAGGTPGTEPSSAAMSPETSRIYAGIGQGLSQGLAEVGATKLEADKERELVEWQAKEDERIRNLNQPGEYQTYAARVTPPDWWEKYTQNVTPRPTTKKGLLA